MDISFNQFESGMEMQISAINLMEKMIDIEENSILQGTSENIEDIGILKEYIQIQKKSSIALYEIMKRQMPNLKKSQSEANKNKGNHNEIKNNSKLSQEDINILEKGFISLF